MRVTFYGHACFKVELNNKSIVFDPFIRGNELAKNIDVKEINPDFLLLSHAHSDHIADALEIANQSNATTYAIYEICMWMNKQGNSSFHPMNIGGTAQTNNICFTMTPALHSSSFEDGSYGGVPCGFIVQNETKCFYYAGDTALFSDMSLISKKRELDFAFLPVGDNFTMGITDAIEAAKLLNVKKVVGMHFDTFGYIKINHQEAVEQFKENNLELILMEIGQTLEI